MKIKHSNYSKGILKTTLLLILFIATIQSGFAQKNNLKLTALTFGQKKISFESAFGSNHSISAGLLIYNNDYNKHEIFPLSDSAPSVYTNKGTRFSGEYRIYLSKKDVLLKGMYFAANASIGQNKINNSNALKIKSTKTGSFGLKTGWQLHAGPILFDFGVNIANNKILGNDEPLQEKGGKEIGFRSDMVGFHPQFFLGIGVAL